MSRVEIALRRRIEALLRDLEPGPRRLELDRIVAETRARAAASGLALETALVAAYEALRDRRGAACPARQAEPPRFLCDQSLGGLARWLRAAGFEAEQQPGLPGFRLPDEAARRRLVLLTTDTEVLERRLVEQGALAVVWMPSSLSSQQKLGFVMRELGLGRREPRCMACGGELQQRSKDEVGGRIPPRTARWKDDYFVCSACNGLFWQGTHWERIVARLEEAAVSR